MMPRGFILHTFVILVAVVLSGCSVNTKLDNAFWEKPSSTMAICLTPYPVVGHVFLDVPGAMLPGNVITRDSWNKELTEFVQTYDKNEFDKVTSIFSHELVNKGMHVIVLDSKACNSLSDAQEHDKETLKALNELKNQTNADYLLLFQIPAWGIVKVLPPPAQYYSLLTMYGSLWDLHNEQIEWQNIWSWSTTRQVRVLGDDWNQPPDYPNVAKAMHQVLTLRIEELYKSFFGKPLIMKN